MTRIQNALIAIAISLWNFPALGADTAAVKQAIAQASKSKSDYYRELQKTTGTVPKDQLSAIKRETMGKANNELQNTTTDVVNKTKSKPLTPNQEPPDASPPTLTREPVLRASSVPAKPGSKQPVVIDASEFAEELEFNPTGP